MKQSLYEKTKILPYVCLMYYTKFNVQDLVSLDLYKLRCVMSRSNTIRDVFDIISSIHQVSKMTNILNYDN